MIENLIGKCIKRSEPLKYIDGSAFSVLMELFSAKDATWLDRQMEKLFIRVEITGVFGATYVFHTKRNTSVYRIVKFLAGVQERVKASSVNDYTHGDFERAETLERALKQWEKAYWYYRLLAEMPEPCEPQPPTVPTELTDTSTTPLKYITSESVSVLMELFSAKDAAWLDLQLDILFVAVNIDTHTTTCQYRLREATTEPVVANFLAKVRMAIDKADARDYTHGDFERADELRSALRCWEMAYWWYNTEPTSQPEPCEPQPVEPLQPAEGNITNVEAGDAASAQLPAQVNVEAGVDSRDASQKPAAQFADILTEDAQRHFDKAIKAGYMTETETGYKWHKSNALLAYFCGHIWCGDYIRNGRNGKSEVITSRSEFFPEKDMKRLFGVANLGQSRQQLTSPRGIDQLETTVFA